MMYLIFIFLSCLFGTISSAPLDPNEQYALCRLQGINTIITNCSVSDPCETIYIGCNNVTGKIEEIEFSSFNLLGSIPSEFGYFTNLREMNINSYVLTGTLPSQFRNLTSLQVLNLQSNYLTGSIPIQLGNITTLRILNLNDNGLVGTIPTEIGNITYLSGLYLATNRLTGTLPFQLGNLNNLVNLTLSGNKLTGPIPNNLGNIITFENLILSNNELTGLIPTQFGNLINIQKLYLNNNNLTGTIPTQLGKLTLVFIDLSNNQLTGTIPTQIANLVACGRIDYSNNPLNMSFPQQSCNPNSQPTNLNPQPTNLNPQSINPNPQQINPNPQPIPQTDNSNTTLVINQTFNLSDRTFIFQIVNISSGSLLLTKNANLKTTIIILSENTILSISSSTIHIQENVTIPTGFILSITNPTTTSLETLGCIDIQSNTTINISLPLNYDSKQALTLLSFKCKTGTFSKININNECIELVENEIGFVLTQRSDRKCTSTSTQKTITIYATIIFIIIFLLF